MRRVSGCWRDNPIEGLYAQARSLRGLVLSRLAGIGCDLEDRPRAEAIVNANIAELIACPEWAMLLDRPGGEDRIIIVLVRSCAAEIDRKIQPVKNKRQKSPRRGAGRQPPLRLVTENGTLLEN